MKILLTTAAALALTIGSAAACTMMKNAGEYSMTTASLDTDKAPMSTVDDAAAAEGVDTGIETGAIEEKKPELAEDLNIFR